MSRNPDPARSRFLILSLVRLAGAFLMPFGIVIASGRLAGWPATLGIVLVAAGAFGFAVAPRLLARRWRSPE